MRFAGGSLGAIIIAELLEVLGVVKQVVSEVVGGSVLRRPVMAAQRVSRRRIARARRPEYAVPDSAGHRSARGATAVAGAALGVISSCRACLHVRGCGRIWSCPSSAVRRSHRRPGWCTAFQARPHRLAGRKLLLLVQIASPWRAADGGGVLISQVGRS